MVEKAKRIADGHSLGSYLEITLDHDGDVILDVRGRQTSGSGESEVSVRFCTRNGGGYHPRTMDALYNLISAIKADNADTSSMNSRYKISS